MNLDSIVTLAGGYGISSAIVFVLVVVGNLVAAWLGQILFPMRLKKEAWKWEKEKWATEQFFESLSRIEFVGKNFIRSEFEEKASLARMGLKETETEIINIMTSLHRDGHRIRPYLSRHNQTVFDDYLKQSSAAFDAAKESYGQWMQDDHEAEAAHPIGFVDEQSSIAGKHIEKAQISGWLKKVILALGRIRKRM